MSAIFISHSSKDNAAATILNERLSEQGHRSVFLDFDPDLGIPPGRDWEQELYHRLRACQAVVVLCSEESIASNWCFAEITHAKALGKHVFPIKIGDCTINTVLTSRQVLDLTQHPGEAYRRLWRGLKSAGLDPADAFDWDGNRSPYPGLLAFQEADAAVFFGRDEEIQKGLELLNRLRQFGGARLVMMLGASGSGKSSLVRAGLLPRLKRNTQQWLVVEPFRPQGQPLRELAIALADAFRTYGEDRSWRDLQERLVRAAQPGAPRGEVLIEMAEDLRIAAGQREATVLLVIDQTEELLGYAGETGGGQFLPFLRAALEAPGSPLMTICTLRSDFLGDFQQHPAVRELAAEDLRVGPMSTGRLVQVIEGPAEMAGLRLEAGLTEVMMRDTETEDALPLLAFTLRELYERCGDDGLLEIKEYHEEMGGLEGSVARAADAVFDAQPLTEAQVADLRSAFVKMVRINEEGQYARQAAAWGDLPVSVRPLLERFVQARLLVARGEGNDRILEVAHEALFRSWDRLKSWLDEDREFLLWQQRLWGAVANWLRAGSDEGALLRGASLAEAEGHLERHRDNLSPDEQAFIEQSVALREREHQARERARQERERMQKRSNRRLRLFLGVALVLTVAAIGLFFWAQQSRAEAVQAAQEAQEAQEETVREIIQATWKAGTLVKIPENWVYGVRGLYGSMKVIVDLEKVQSLSPVSVFASGPHTSELNFESYDFGRYNPAFARWAEEHLIPAAEDGLFREATQPVYDTFIKEMARIYYYAYRDLHADPELLASIKTEYLRKVDLYKDLEHNSSNQFDPDSPGEYIQEAFRSYSDAMRRRTYDWMTDNAWYYANVAPGFWVRREIDSTAADFFQGLEKLLRTYDAEFLGSPVSSEGPLQRVATLLTGRWTTFSTWNPEAPDIAFDADGTFRRYDGPVPTTGTWEVTGLNQLNVNGEAVSIGFATAGGATDTPGAPTLDFGDLTYVKMTAEEIEKADTFEEEPNEALAALLIGRWSGPDADNSLVLIFEADGTTQWFEGEQETIGTWALDASQLIWNGEVLPYQLDGGTLTLEFPDTTYVLARN